MKKLLFGAIAAVVLAQPSMAQDSENLDVWKRNKGVTLSYITHQSLKFTDSEIPLQYDSKSGFSFSTGTTYLWPRSAGWAGNRLKVGVDARWLDISYVKYKKYPKVNGVQLENWMFDPASDTITISTMIMTTAMITMTRNSTPRTSIPSSFISE